MSLLQRKIKSRNAAVNTIEKAYENVNKTNEEDIIAIIEVIEKNFERLCGLIYNGCLQSEVNITKKINTLKPLVDKGKGLIKNNDSKPESFNRKFVNSPTEINY